MRYRGVRIVLLLVFMAALGMAAYRIFELERRIAAEAERGRAFDALSWTLAGGILDLRAAQQAYVSVGQGEAYRMERVSSRLETLQRDLAILKESAGGSEAADELNAASNSLESFQQMDASARGYLANGQRLLASDLIFTDGIELSAEIGGRITTARLHDRATSDRVIWPARLDQASFAASAGLVGLIVAALLVSPVRARAAAPRAPSEEPAPAPAPAEAIDENDVLANASLHPELPKPVPVGAVQAETGADGETLQAAAALCTTFGRVSDAGDLPPALERAAELLDASGLIIWVANGTGLELRPALAHGYSTSALSRLGPIGRDDDNATALAFRNASLEIVESDGRASGAVIAPLLGPAGCTGVLAAEVRHGKESSDATRAIAAIVAAQVASLSATPVPDHAADEPARGVG